MPTPHSTTPDDLFEAFFDLSLMGGILFEPVLDADGEIIDLAYARLNPAAQRLLALPAQPGQTFLALYPHALPTGVFAFYREAYASGEARRAEFNYQYDGLNNYFHLAARRVGQQLLVSFTDTSEQPRTAVEQALRDSQTREQLALAEARHQQQMLRQVMENASMPLALFRGRDYVVELANPALAALWGRPLGEVVGRPVFEALPDLRSQGFEEILAGVLHTGQPFLAQEIPAVMDRHHLGLPALGYFNISYQALPGAASESAAVIIASAVEVTAQVLARRQVEQLNHELEARVQERTRELAEQKGLLSRILKQVPAAVATLSGPSHRFTFFNDDYQAIVAGRAQLGKTLVEAVPEVVEQGFVALLDRVYQTGEAFVSRAVPAQLYEPATGELVQHYVDLSYQALVDEHGHTTGILAFVVDVTEGALARRQADTLQAAMLAVSRRQVQQREELFQVFEQAPAAIMLLREPEHRVEYVNPAYQQFFPGLELRGRLLAEVHPAATALGVIARLDGVYATGEAYVGEEEPLTLTLVPGQPPQTRYFNFTYQPYREAGRIVGVSIFAYEVTAAALARRQAAQQARQFQELYEHAPMAVTILRGPEFIVELANPVILRLWGLTAAEALGRPRLELIPEAGRASLRATLETAYRTRQTHHVQEMPVVLGRAHAGQPEVSYFNFIYQPLFDEQGQPAALTCVGIEVTEQVLARQAIEATARQLKLITDSLPVLIGYLDLEERYQFANEAYRAWFNQDPQALLGRPVRELVGEQAYATAKPYLDRALAGERLNFESRMPYRAGFVKHIRTSYVPDMRAGKLHGFYTLVTDITDETLARQQVEQLNHELEARVQARTQEVQTAQAAAERERALLQALLTQAPVAIGLFRGEEVRVAAVNAMMAALWGYTPEQVVGRPLLEGVPELRGQGFDSMLRQVLRTQVPISGTETPATMLRDGELKTTYYNFVYQPLYDADGQVLGVISVSIEVTEQVLARRQVEQLNQELETRVQERTRQLSEQQALLRQILGQVPASIATLSGAEHRYTFFNELYQELSANRTELGLTVAGVFPEVVEQGFIKLLDQVYITGEPFVGTDVPAQLYDSSLGQLRQYYVDFIYQPLFDKQRRVQGILAFILDVTDRALARQQVEQSQQQVLALNQELAAINEELRATNEELQDSNARLTRTNNDLDTFVYTASHDLKAPINNIEGLLNALRDYLPAEQNPDAMVPRLLGMMDGAVIRFLQTISHLTDVSRIQHAAHEPAEAIGLADLVTNVRLDLAPLLEATHARLLVDIDTCPTVYFSPKNLRSIIYNLLSNALKYRDPARPLVVQFRAHHSAGQVVLEVADNGLGLNEPQQARLFSLFQRLHTHVEGTGVGLYMLKKIVENADGTIVVQSQPGVGSTFTVTLPRVWPAGQSA